LADDPRPFPARGDDAVVHDPARRRLRDDAALGHPAARRPRGPRSLPPILSHHPAPPPSPSDAPGPRPTPFPVAVADPQPDPAPPPSPPGRLRPARRGPGPATR